MGDNRAGGGSSCCSRPGHRPAVHVEKQSMGGARGLHAAMEAHRISPLDAAAIGACCLASSSVAGTQASGLPRQGTHAGSTAVHTRHGREPLHREPAARSSPGQRLAVAERLLRRGPASRASSPVGAIPSSDGAAASGICGSDEQSMRERLGIGEKGKSGGSGVEEHTVGFKEVLLEVW